MGYQRDTWIGRFADRVDAGRHLAARLSHLRGEEVVVLGLPRGGVPVAFEVAASLGAPLDVIVVRKLGLPGHRELAMGAIGEGGFEFLDRAMLARAGVTAEQLREVEERERIVLADRVARLRRGRERIDLAGRTVVIVDDGIATGSTARVACEVALHLGAARVVLAVPVAPAETVHEFDAADEVVCVTTPFPFLAVGYAYQDFAPTTDDQVIALLDAAAGSARAERAGASVDIDVQIPADGVLLEGHLRLPSRPKGVVVFAHGSGSSRHSTRNQYVASVLFKADLGTLLLDLLTPAEEQDRAKVFDIALLARRLTAAVRWVQSRPDVPAGQVGLFGASTGAGAALLAASDPELGVAAVVSRGGRPDLAAERLGKVDAPTLLIVGGADNDVLRLNEWARTRLRCANDLVVVPGATHLFEEPGALPAVATLAKTWFEQYLRASDRHGRDDGQAWTSAVS